MATINSFGVPQLPLACPLMFPLLYSSPQSSNNLKHPLSSLSQMKPTPMSPPVSAPSIFYIAIVTWHGTKCSHTSASQNVGDSTAGHAVQKNMTGKNTIGITFQQVDSSICHLSDSITRSFVYLLNVLRNLLTALSDRLLAVLGLPRSCYLLGTMSPTCNTLHYNLCKISVVFVDQYKAV